MQLSSLPKWQQLGHREQKKTPARFLRASVRQWRRAGMLDATHHQDESTRGVRMSRSNRNAQHNLEDARGP